jgi:predicted ferric reductase
MNILDVCAYLGLAAVGTATVNMVLGLLIALRYSPVRLWPHRRINIFVLHRWTAYLVLLLIVLHPCVLLLRNTIHFGLGDVLLPLWSPVQPTLNTLGAVGLYGLLIVIVTSVFRLRMARPLWKKLHLLVFPAFVFVFIHSMLSDPQLSNNKVDFLDGGKLFIDLCGAIALFTSAARVRLRGQGFRAQARGTLDSPLSSGGSEAGSAQG